MKLRRILFVCTGNTCRSPMAEMIFKHMLEKEGIRDVDVFSRGISASAGQPLSEGSRHALDKAGIAVRPHRSQNLGAEDMEKTDAILVMTEDHRRILVGRYPSFKNKIRLLGTDDIADPIGGSPNDYEKCRIEIQSALLDLFSELKK